MKIYIIKKKRLFIIVLFLMAVLVVSVFGFRPSKESPVMHPVYIGNTGKKAVALMVNVDWGEDILPQMLEVLKAKDVKATFFITGRFAHKFPELVKDIFADGHEIGNHGYSHPHADNISKTKNKEEIEKTEQAFSAIEIMGQKIFAPPYGEHKPHVVEAALEMGYQTIMWTIDTVDWQDPPAGKIVEKVTGLADNGSLILMHPKECTLAALPQVIDILKEKGFAFRTVTEIIH